MKLLKAATAVAMICVLMFSMTGCDALDYRDAIDLYNAGDYEAAAEMFYALGEYENCSELYTDCQYWMTVSLAQQGNYADALPRFIKLGDYENSAQWVTECNYQMAVASFNESNLADAEILFGEIPEYKNTQEYLRQITWQKFFDRIAETPLEAEQNGKMFSLSAEAETNRLVFFVAYEIDSGYTFRDDLTLTLSRDSLIAELTATDSFTMGIGDTAVGTEQIMRGRVDISTCTAETVPVIDAFEKTVNDNQGNTSTSTDLADCLMTDEMISNFCALMTVIPEMITHSGMEFTLSDIGFAAM